MSDSRWTADELALALADLRDIHLPLGQEMAASWMEPWGPMLLIAGVILGVLVLFFRFWRQRPVARCRRLLAQALRQTDERTRTQSVAHHLKTLAAERDPACAALTGAAWRECLIDLAPVGDRALWAESLAEWVSTRAYQPDAESKDRDWPEGWTAALDRWVDRNARERGRS